MPIIYRVETVDGIGIYGAGVRCANLEMDDSRRHPLPTEDAELSDFWGKMSLCDRGGIRFGYSSINQLKSWIYKKSWRKEIAKSGLIVSVYRARFVRVGATQAVFKLKTAKKIGTVDILNLDAPMVKV